MALFILGQTSFLMASVTPNLLLNGDAEYHRCTDDWTAQTSIPGWTVLRGAASVLCYSAFKYANETPNLPSSTQHRAGKAFFGAPGIDTAIEQTVDVSAAASTIDNGAVTFLLSGWLGGWHDRLENAIVTAVFLDANDKSTGLPVQLSASTKERNHLTALVALNISGKVPIKTRKIMITVNFLTGMTSFHNAYADNLSLILEGDVANVKPAQLTAASGGIPKLDHIYVVMMENTNFYDVINIDQGKVIVNSNMPFLASFVPQSVVLTNMWGTYHPSNQNYVAMVAGDTFKYGTTYYPNYRLTAKHLGDLLDAHGKSWAAYVQNMGTPCNLTAHPNGSWYAPDDQPFANFLNVIENPTRCAKVMRDLKDFKKAIKSDKLPSFAWIAADAYSDGEGAWLNNYDVNESLAEQDKFLRLAFQELLSSAPWKNSRSLLIITWDENQAWGWPDNRVPTFLIGSPGLLKEGAIINTHYNGYSVLKTIEKAFDLGSLNKFDTYANSFEAAFIKKPFHANIDLTPALSLSTRGTIRDTFGRNGTTAAVEKGKKIQLIRPDNLTPDTIVTLVPIDQVPTASAIKYNFSPGTNKVSIPTDQLEPGVYGAWYQPGTTPYRAPIPITILPNFKVTPQSPGIEIVGSLTSNDKSLPIREGANLIVHYCLPKGAATKEGWIGIFETGTPTNQFTKKNADHFSVWIKTPGSAPDQLCGEAAVFTAELPVEKTYEIHMLLEDKKGNSKTVGQAASIAIIPALPSPHSPNSISH
ncbi:MAG: alkaline phosphatase family protein [Candidatus Berkiellales bacterium]